MQNQAKTSDQFEDDPYHNQSPKLTPRQMEVLSWVSKGKTNMQIAQELGISEKTVKNHRQNMCSELDLEGRNALYHYSLEVFGIS